MPLPAAGKDEPGEKGPTGTPSCLRVSDENLEVHGELGAQRTGGSSEMAIPSTPPPGFGLHILFIRPRQVSVKLSILQAETGCSDFYKTNMTDCKSVFCDARERKLG